MGPDEIAVELLAAVGLLARRVRQVRVEGEELTNPERVALSRLDRAGSATSAELARQEQITPQALGATFGALQERGLVERRADPDDGRRKVLTVSAAGARVLRENRSSRTDLLARGLAAGFTPDELDRLAAALPLLTRLAHGI